MAEEVEEGEKGEKKERKKGRAGEDKREEERVTKNVVGVGRAGMEWGRGGPGEVIAAGGGGGGNGRGRRSGLPLEGMRRMTPESTRCMCSPPGPLSRGEWVPGRGISCWLAGCPLG